MSQEKQNVTVNGIGFFGLLTIVLIALKLAGVAEISWGIILACLIAPLLLFLSFFIVFFAILVIAGLCRGLFLVGIELARAFSKRAKAK